MFKWALEQEQETQPVRRGTLDRPTICAASLRYRRGKWPHMAVSTLEIANTSRQLYLHPSFRRISSA